jgi:phosphoribosylformylglycinamidine cyclo-ligase
VKAGDRLVGVASSGFHSNGYSLLRKLFARDFKKHADMLMTPTHLYSPLVQKLKPRGGLHAVAHVTGGGMENLLRVIPDGTALKMKPWPIPKMFLEVKKRGRMEWKELLTTLNCGIGLVLYVDAGRADGIAAQVREAGFASYDLGQVVTAKQKDWHLDFSALSGGH